MHRIRLLPLAIVLGLAGCASPSAATMAPPQTPSVERSTSTFAAGLIPSEQTVLDQSAGDTRYSISLTLADDLRSATGIEQVTYTNQEALALDSLVFRLLPNVIGGTMSVSSVSLHDAPVESSLELQGSALRVPLSPALEPGGRADLTLEYAVTVPEDSDSGYGLLSLSDGILSLSHGYPMIPVYDDEGWNVELPPDYADLVYADAAFFEVTVEAAADLVLTASGVETVHTTEGTRQHVTFVAGPARDFQLAAGRDFERRSAAVRETTLNSYAFPEFQTASGNVLDYAASAVTYFDDLLGTYPYTELDFVSVAIDAMGVEYPGIISLDLSFYDPLDDTYPKSWLESVVVHEVAHQWFYGVVGNDQLDDPWLDESLAQYLTLRYFADRYGMPAADGFRQSLVDRWDRVERAPIPIGLPVREYTQLEYGAIVYGRGGLFFEALADRLGQPATDEFLRDYYQSQRWGIATPQSLQAAAESHCGCDLDALFDEWVAPN